MSRDDLYLAHIYANHCSNALLRAYAVRNLDEGGYEFERTQATCRLAELAAALGFDLTKRITADEATTFIYKDAA